MHPYRLSRPAGEAIPAAEELEVGGGDAQHGSGFTQLQVEESMDVGPRRRTNPSAGHGDRHKFSFLSG